MIKNMFKKTNRITLLSLVLVILIVLIGSIFLIIKSSSILKSDNEKWEEFKPILKEDSVLYNNGDALEKDILEKHYPIIKDINCEKLLLNSNKKRCNNYKESALIKKERPFEIKIGEIRTDRDLYQERLELQAYY